jgi:short-subunit dehydrogenase
MKKMINNEFLLGKKVIITGGSSGIGRTLAIELSKMGAVVGLISRSVDKMEEITQIVKKNNGECYFIPTDLRDYSSLKKSINDLISNMGGCDVLINNAGVMRKKFLAKKTVEQIDLEIDTNIKGVLYATHCILPYFIEKKNGMIITTSSVASVNPSEGMSVYGCTKAAINNFTQALSIETKTKKVWVNAILPGFIDTPMLRFGISDAIAKALDPLMPEDLVPYYAFFVSEKSKKVTGTLVNIEDFRTAFREIDAMDESQPRTWKDLEPILKERIPAAVYVSIKKNRKLAKFLINWKYN